MTNRIHCSIQSGKILIAGTLNSKTMIIIVSRIFQADFYNEF
jgi:hypothetical protein